MLIYCSRIFLVPTETRRPLLKTVADWLSDSTRSRVDPALLETDGQRQLPERRTIDCLTAEHEGEALHSVRYVHPDRVIQGKEWITEIGIRHTRTTFLCSVLLRTHERSALVDPNVQTTRPKLVPSIFKTCRIASETCGGPCRPLRLEDAESFLDEVKDPSRTHPIVQISPSENGMFLVNPDRVASLLAGVASVVAIPLGEDTFSLEDIVGSRFSCYHGAVNVIWPRLAATAGSAIPNYRVMGYQIEQTVAQGASPEDSLLAAVCHRMNETYARDHVSLEMVRSIKHRAALAEAYHNATKTDPELERLYQVVDVDQKAEIAKLKDELKRRDSDVAAAQATAQELEQANEALKASLSAKAARTAPQAPEPSVEEIKELLATAAAAKMTLPDCLRTIGVLYPDRVVILDSARKSAEDAENFKYPGRAFELLQTLCTQYWQALVDGKGDAEARRVFGPKSFASNEAGPGRTSKRSRDLRSFSYNGKAVVMMMHLKIGAPSEGSAETWRAHFEWDPESRRIVLGHCGKHLDHK